MLTYRKREKTLEIMRKNLPEKYGSKFALFNTLADEGIASESRSSIVLKPNYRQRKERKTGLTTIELQRRFPDLYEAASKVKETDDSAAPAPTAKQTR